MSSQKSSRISCAAIVFSSRMMCSTCSRLSSRSFQSAKAKSPPTTCHLTQPYSNLKEIRKSRDSEEAYPDPGGGLLAGLEELGDVPAHLAQLQLPPVPQQLYPRDRQLQQRLAARAHTPTHDIRIKTNQRESTHCKLPGTWLLQEDGSPGEQGKKKNGARYHLAPRKPPPPPLLKKASSIDMAHRRRRRSDAA